MVEFSITFLARFQKYSSLNLLSLQVSKVLTLKQPFGECNTPKEIKTFKIFQNSMNEMYANLHSFYAFY